MFRHLSLRADVSGSRANGNAARAEVMIARFAGDCGVTVRKPALEPEADEPDVLPSAPAQEIAQRRLAGALGALSLRRQVLALAAWPLLEQSLNFLVGFVDTTLAGHLSVDATKAIAVTAYIGWLMGLMQAAVGIGATAVIARATGARDRRLASAALGQALVLGLAVGIGMGAIVWLAAPSVARFLELDGPSLAMAVTYLRIIALAAPASSLLLVGNASLRGAGDMLTPALVMMVVNVVNTFVSAMLTFGPSPIGGWGVTGIAAGTAVAWCVGAMLIATVLLLGWGGLKLRLPRLRPRGNVMRRIVKVGLPNLAESAGMWAGNFAVIKIVGMVGRLMDPAALGAHVVAIRVEAISYLPGYALGTAAATITGMYLGLGDPGRARATAQWCWAAVAIVMGSLGVVFMLAPGLLVRVVTNEPALLATAPTLLRMAGAVQAFFGSAIVLAQAMRGAGDTRTTMWLTYLSTFLVRLPAVYLLGITAGLGLVGVWIGLCGELVFRGVLFSARFLHGGWTRVRV